jgi:hypothetical protein
MRFATLGRVPHRFGRQDQDWYDDAVANDEIEDDARTIRDKALALHSAGLITLSGEVE